MKKLKNIINGLETTLLDANLEIKINNICVDSRFVEKNDIFVAIDGNNQDGHKYINEALENGASLIIAEKQKTVPLGYYKIYVKNSRKALSKICANFYGNPSKKLKIIGITGTNGKSTTCTLLYDLFNLLNLKSGLISTINIDNGKTKFPSIMTTPDPIVLNKLFYEMLKNGCQYCFMEVSSHAIIQNRIDNIHFTSAIFTNITHDHLDYHKDFESYIKAKKKLFDILPKTSTAIINKDDKNSNKIAEHCKSKKVFYSLNSIENYNIKIIEKSMSGTMLEYNNQEFFTSLIGEYNVYNLLSVISCATEIGIKEKPMIKKISKLKAPEGRFETIISKKGIISIIDYAHTPDALIKIINTINQTKLNTQKLLTIIGCGGNRDFSKREKMGLISFKKSDYVIFTSDNPRDEKPEKIIEDMMLKIEDKNSKKIFKIIDRKEAIEKANTILNKNDIMLIAGKGHEGYQIIKGKKNRFNDKEIVQSL